MGRPLATLALLASLLAPGGGPAAAPPPVRADSISPKAAAIYQDSDPFAGMKRRIEALMGVYLVDPPRRHASERVEVTGGKRVRIDLWVPVARLTDVELKTRAVEWLVFGRTQYASGARGIFSEMPGVEEVTLVFHEVIRPDNRGRRRNQAKPEQIKRYLALQLTRERFLRFDPAPAEGCVGRGDCADVFRAGFSAHRIDRAYTAKRRQEEDP